MPRPLHLLEPATTWFVTTRCIDARFLLRPDAALNTALGLCLSRAARRHPGIRLLGLVPLSNHLHPVELDCQPAVLPLPGGGRRAYDSLEHPTEVTLVGEACLERDFGMRQRG